jgi:hypothetical protein
MHKVLVSSRILAEERLETAEFEVRLSGLTWLDLAQRRIAPNSETTMSFGFAAGSRNGRAAATASHPRPCLATWAGEERSKPQIGAPIRAGGS